MPMSNSSPPSERVGGNTRRARRSASITSGVIAAIVVATGWLSPSSAAAQNYYWDVDGNTTTGVGGTGTWTAANLWRVGGPTPSDSLGTWINSNNAHFQGNAGVVTIGSTAVTALTTFVQVTGYTFQPDNSTTTRTLNGNIVLGSNVNLNLMDSAATAARALNIGGSISGGAGSSLTIRGNQTGANASRVNLSVAGATISVPITINATGAGVVSLVATAANTAISGTITNNSSSATSIGAGSGFSITVSGVVAGSQALQFSQGTDGGAGIITLSSNSTYAGNTYFNTTSAGVVRLALNNALPSATTLFFAQAASGLTPDVGGTLDLNGFNQTVGALSGTGRGIVNNTAGLSTLTVGQSSGTTIYAAVIGIPGVNTNITNATNNIALIKTGNSNQVLMGANTYTGGTTILGGTLTLSGNNRLATTASITLNGGTLALGDFSQTVAGLTLIGGGVSGTGAITNSIDYDVRSGTISTTLAGAVGLAKTTSGTVVLNGAGTYSGATTVGGGTLVVNGSLASPTVSVAGGAMLKGSGGVTGTIFVAEGGILSPGNSVESLTAGGLSLTHGSHLVFEFLDAAGDTAGTHWDLIDLGLSGVLNLGDATAANPITLHIDSWKLDNSGHGGGPSDDPLDNNFDPSQSYEWLFIKVADLGNLAMIGDDDFSRRFIVIDDESNAGVFDTGSGNPFARPTSTEGEGTFKAAWKGGTAGFGLYIQYSAVPEPGSMLLAATASAAAGWHGRRRRAGRAATTAVLP